MLSFITSPLLAQAVSDRIMHKATRSRRNFLIITIVVSISGKFYGSTCSIVGSILSSFVHRITRRNVAPEINAEIIRGGSCYSICPTKKRFICRRIRDVKCVFPLGRCSIASIQENKFICSIRNIVIIESSVLIGFIFS